jgi:hypothetical protein
MARWPVGAITSGPEGFYVGQATVPWGLTGVVAIAAGNYHSLALKSDGSVARWGDNSQNQCGLPAALTNIVALAAGGAHTIALRADGTALAWGANWNGQCNLPVTLGDVVALDAGAAHTLFLVDGCAPEPRLLKPCRNGLGFTVRVQTLCRKDYALEFADSLHQPAWLALPAFARQRRPAAAHRSRRPGAAKVLPSRRALTGPQCRGRNNCKKLEANRPEISPLLNEGQLGPETRKRRPAALVNRDARFRRRRRLIRRPGAGLPGKRG